MPHLEKAHQEPNSASKRDLHNCSRTALADASNERTPEKFIVAYVEQDYRTLLVPFLRAILVLLIVLGCAAFSQTCLITNLASAQLVDCCEHELPSSDSGSSACAQCVTLESGVDRVAPNVVSLTAPTLITDVLLSAVMALVVDQAEHQPVLDTSAPADFSPLWHFVARTALPVRGPSLIA